MDPSSVNGMPNNLDSALVSLKDAYRLIYKQKRELEEKDEKISQLEGLIMYLTENMGTNNSFDSLPLGSLKDKSGLSGEGGVGISWMLDRKRHQEPSIAISLPVSPPSSNKGSPSSDNSGAYPPVTPTASSAMPSIIPDSQSKMQPCGSSASLFAEPSVRGLGQRLANSAHQRRRRRGDSSDSTLSSPMPKDDIKDSPPDNLHSVMGEDWQRVGSATMSVKRYDDRSSTSSARPSPPSPKEVAVTIMHDNPALGKTLATNLGLDSSLRSTKSSLSEREPASMLTMIEMKLDNKSSSGSYSGWSCILLGNAQCSVEVGGSAPIERIFSDECDVNVNTSPTIAAPRGSWSIYVKMMSNAYIVNTSAYQKKGYFGGEAISNIVSIALPLVESPSFLRTSNFSRMKGGIGAELDTCFDFSSPAPDDSVMGVCDISTIAKLQCLLDHCTDSRVDVIFDPSYSVDSSQEWLHKGYKVHSINKSKNESFSSCWMFPYWERDEKGAMSAPPVSGAGISFRTRKMAPQFRSKGIGYIRLGDDLSQHGLAFVSLDKGYSYVCQADNEPELPGKNSSSLRSEFAEFSVPEIVALIEQLNTHCMASVALAPVHGNSVASASPGGGSWQEGVTSWKVVCSKFEYVSSVYFKEIITGGHNGECVFAQSSLSANKRLRLPHDKLSAKEAESRPSIPHSMASSLLSLLLNYLTTKQKNLVMVCTVLKCLPAIVPLCSLVLSSASGSHLAIIEDILKESCKLVKSLNKSQVESSYTALTDMLLFGKYSTTREYWKPLISLSSLVSPCRFKASSGSPAVSARDPSEKENFGSTFDFSSTNSTFMNVVLNQSGPGNSSGSVQRLIQWFGDVVRNESRLCVALSNGYAGCHCTGNYENLKRSPELGLYQPPSSDECIMLVKIILPYCRNKDTGIREAALVVVAEALALLVIITKVISFANSSKFSLPIVTADSLQGLLLNEGGNGMLKVLNEFVNAGDVAVGTSTVAMTSLVRSKSGGSQGRSSSTVRRRLGVETADKPLSKQKSFSDLNDTGASADSFISSNLCVYVTSSLNTLLSVFLEDGTKIIKSSKAIVSPVKAYNPVSPPPKLGMLGDMWYEVKLLLRSPIPSSASAWTKAGEVIDGASDFFRKLSVIASSPPTEKIEPFKHASTRAMVIRQLLPFDEATSSNDQSKVSSNARSSNNEFFTSLQNQAIDIRKLMRVKMADEADIKQAVAGMIMLKKFCDALREYVSKSNESYESVVNQLEMCI